MKNENGVIMKLTSRTAGPAVERGLRQRREGDDEVAGRILASDEGARHCAAPFSLAISFTRPSTNASRRCEYFEGALVRGLHADGLHDGST